MRVLSLVLTIIIAVQSIVSLKAIIEDEDLLFDSSCRNIDIISYEGFSAGMGLPSGNLCYNYLQETLYSESIILYLERQEKSPPCKAIV